MVKDLFKKQNDINELPKLDNTRYENIFRLGQINDYYFYNITKKVNFPEDLDPQFYTLHITESYLPLTTLSYQFYGTMDLWWVIMLASNITNPIKNIKPGTTLKILKIEVIEEILKRINEQS